MQNPEYSHNLEIELKARVQQREEVESRLSSFMHYIGPINKLDEYWEVSNARLGDFGGFRFRVRHELAMWAINQAKWKAAKQFANNNGMKFMIITELDLETLNGK